MYQTRSNFRRTIAISLSNSACMTCAGRASSCARACNSFAIATRGSSSTAQHVTRSCRYGSKSWSKALFGDLVRFDRRAEHGAGGVSTSSTSYTHATIGGSSTLHHACRLTKAAARVPPRACLIASIGIAGASRWSPPAGLLGTLARIDDSRIPAARDAAGAGLHMLHCLSRGPAAPAPDTGTNSLTTFYYIHKMCHSRSKLFLLTVQAVDFPSAGG